MMTLKRFLFLIGTCCSTLAWADGPVVGLMVGSEQITEDTRNFVSKAQFSENPSSEHIQFEAKSTFIRGAVRWPLRSTGIFTNFVGLGLERLSSTQVTRETISTTTTLKLTQNIGVLEYGMIRQLAGSIGFTAVVAYGYGLNSSGTYTVAYKGDIPDESTSVSGAKGRTLTVHPGISWEGSKSVILALHLGYRWNAATFTKEADISPMLYAFSGYSAGLSLIWTMN